MSDPLDKLFIPKRVKESILKDKFIPDTNYSFGQSNNNQVGSISFIESYKEKMKRRMLNKKILKSNPNECIYYYTLFML